RIRAAQGHSIEVDLALEPAVPPNQLYHGTALAKLGTILAEGLTPQSRQHVHLSIDEDTATRVGQRHGEPIVLKVAAGQMSADGKVFWRADNGVWLTDVVAPEYLSH
ncbi:MAG: RNA 2'-phosphotransferase, partial [Pseudomonadota bacterium]